MQPTRHRHVGPTCPRCRGAVFVRFRVPPGADRATYTAGPLGYYISFSCKLKDPTSRRSCGQPVVAYLSGGTVLFAFPPDFDLADSLPPETMLEQWGRGVPMPLE